MGMGFSTSPCPSLEPSKGVSGVGWEAKAGVGSLAGFLQVLGSGESLCRGEGTAKSKGKMEGATRTGKS